jgi:hypothetical protein
MAFYVKLLTILQQMMWLLPIFFCRWLLLVLQRWQVPKPLRGIQMIREFAILFDPDDFQRVKCKLCGKEMSRGVNRMKQHIAQYVQP